MNIKLILAGIALALPCSLAQTQEPAPTWHGLRFGETRDQVRADLTAQNIPVETSQEGSLQSTTDYDLFLPGLRYTLPLLSSYHFADAGGLMDVTLRLDLTAMRHNWASLLGPDEAMLRFASDHLAGALAGRYGAPLYHSPGCDPGNKEPAASCIIFWNGPDQSIELERYASHQGPQLMVRYQMLAADL